MFGSFGMCCLLLAILDMVGLLNIICSAENGNSLDFFSCLCELAVLPSGKWVLNILTKAAVLVG